MFNYIVEIPTYIAVYYVIKKIFLQILFFEASRGAVVRARDRKRDRLCVRSPHEKMKYFIFCVLTLNLIVVIVSS